MSTAKFSVIAVCRVLANAAKNRARHIATEIPRAEKLTESEEKPGNRLTPSDSRGCKQIFENSKEPLNEGVICEKFFPGPQQKCKPPIESTDYQRAYQALTLKSEDLEKYVEEESRSILEQLENELRDSNVEYCTLLARSSLDVGLKLRELAHLDASCDVLKRQEMLVVHDQTCQAIGRSRSDAVPAVQRICRMLERIREELAASAAKAIGSLLSCRDCESPQDHAKCIAKEMANAEKIFDETVRQTEQKLRTVKSLRDKVVRQHKTAMDEVMVVYRVKTIGLDRQLQKSINAFKDMDD